LWTSTVATPLPAVSVMLNELLGKAQVVEADTGGEPETTAPKTMAALAMAAISLFTATPTLVPAGRLHME
jgi:hypothetical protein